MLPLLNNRSEGSIEFKHQNISAELINLGRPYIRGYKPRFNAQKILRKRIEEYLQENSYLEELFKVFADKEITTLPKIKDFDKLKVEPPVTDQLAEPPMPSYGRGNFKINYLEREQRNMQLGILGEQLVLEYEKWNLEKIGKAKLAKEIIWISQEEGDGAGYDILSKYPDGEDKYIEVKTTKLGKETPFFFSSNELSFSQDHYNNYNLFRVFNFDSKAQLFIKQGGLDSICNSIPTMYKGFF